MSTRSGGHQLLFTDQLVILFMIQLANWRWSWPQMLLTGILTPVLTVVTLGFYARAISGEAALYALSGSITMALLFESQNRIASNFAFMRQNGSFEFFASHPLRKEGVILSSIAAFALLAVPAVSVTMLLGSWILGVKLQLAWWGVPTLLLLTLPMGAIGALIGNCSQSLEQASSISLAVTLSCLSAGSVAVPPGMLPVWVNALSWINPAYYAADILRFSLFGFHGTSLPWSVAFLTGFSIIGWIAAVRTLRWRS